MCQERKTSRGAGPLLIGDTYDGKKLSSDQATTHRWYLSPRLKDYITKVQFNDEVNYEYMKIVYEYMKTMHKVEFVNLFYSIPNVNHNLLKEKLEGILVHILSAMKYTKPREKLLTGPILFICAMYISHTLIGKSASR